MTLVSNLRQKLAESAVSADRHDFQVADPDTGSAVTLTLVRRDALSSLAWEIRVRRPSPAGLDLPHWAADIAERVTSLLEPLKVLEVDTLRNQALLRSTLSARQRQDTPTYFEVLLDGTTSAVIHRYQTVILSKVEGAAVPRREQVAFALTHEGLLKLVGDVLG